MDFDPNGVKWQCCCCQLPTGLQALAIAEMVLTTAVAVGTAVHIAGDSQVTSTKSRKQVCFPLSFIFLLKKFKAILVDPYLSLFLTTIKKNF